MSQRLEPINLAASMLIGFLILGVLVALFLLWPISLSDLTSRAQPAASYEDAMQRVKTIHADEATKALSEGGRTIVLSHGHPTERVFVLLHGLTNAPVQFQTLGKLLFERGANVVIPRLAHHGLADRMNTDQGNLRATDLIHQAETGLDIAAGLGERITVVGLSVSGVAAAWIAQNRDEAASVFLLAPFLGPKPVPDWLTSTAARALSRLPNGFIWWDGAARENLPGSPYVYPRFATRQIGETLRLGLSVEAMSAHPMNASHIHVVLTDADAAVNNKRTLRLLDQWKTTSPDTTFDLTIFPQDEQVPHDFIDPAQPDAQTERIYPKLIEWLFAD